MTSYKFKSSGREFETQKIKKDDVRYLTSAIGRVTGLANYFREINGIVGGESRISEMWTPFGGNEGKISDLTGYEAAKVAFLAEIPAIITSADMVKILAKSAEIFNLHIPIVDKRKTRDEIAEREAKVKVMQEAMANASCEWVSKFAGSSEKITVPEGYVAITLQYCYDNSNSMTDYFDHHHGWYYPLLLGILPRGNETEAKLRTVLNRYSNLKEIEWKWHTEKYSMGHGNYLECGIQGETYNTRAYDGQTSPPYFFEIEYSGYSKGSSYLPFPGYPGDGGTPATQIENQQNSAFTVTYDHDWTWINFPEKPADHVLEAMHNLKGRFSGKRRMWYFTSHLEEEIINAAIAETAITEANV